MKTRNGFVSNSSSSSYIVAILQPCGGCPTCGISISDLLDTIDNLSENDGEFGIDESLRERIEEVRDEARSYDEAIENPNLVLPQWFKGNVEDYRNSLKGYKRNEEKRAEELEGYLRDYDSVRAVTISYHSPGLYHLLTALEKCGVIKILEGDGG